MIADHPARAIHGMRVATIGFEVRLARVTKKPAGFVQAVESLESR